MSGTYSVVAWEISSVLSFAGIAPEVIRLSATYRSDATFVAGLNFLFMF